MASNPACQKGYVAEGLFTCMPLVAYRVACCRRAGERVSYFYAPALPRSCFPSLRLSNRISAFLLPSIAPIVFSASTPSFSVPACLAVLPLPSGSPVALRFSYCLAVLRLLSGSPLWSSFVFLSFIILLLPLPLQRVRAGDLPPAPCLYAIFLRCLRRTLIISSWKYNSCLPSTRYHSPFCVKQ